MQIFETYQLGLQIKCGSHQKSMKNRMSPLLVFVNFDQLIFSSSPVF